MKILGASESDKQANQKLGPQINPNLNLTLILCNTIFDWSAFVRELQIG